MKRHVNPYLREKIREQRKAGASDIELAHKYNLSRQTIWKICNITSKSDKMIGFGQSRKYDERRLDQ